MSTFRITLSDGVYTVAHYVAGDPNPSPTEQTFTSGPEAWVNAFGRASKHSCITQKPTTVEVCTVGDPRRFTVVVTENEA